MKCITKYYCYYDLSHDYYVLFNRNDFTEIHRDTFKGIYNYILAHGINTKYVRLKSMNLKEFLSDYASFENANVDKVV